MSRCMGIMLLVLVFFSLTSALCPSRFSSTRHYRGYCFAYFSVSKTWSEANEVCRNSTPTGQLMRVNSYSHWSVLRSWVNYQTVWTAGFTQDFIETQNSSSLELNGTAPFENSTTVTRLTPNATWWWSDSSYPGDVDKADQIRSLSWQSSYPARATGSCLAIGRYSWSFLDCEQRAPFVCQYGPCVYRINVTDVATISSPNYPQYYLANMYCEWLIDVGNGSAVLSIENFRMEDSCSYDYLKVYERNGSQLLATLCLNSEVGRIIRSPSRYMYIVMRTDGSGQYPGFQATVRNSFAPTQTRLTATHGLVTTGSFPENYQNGIHHNWLLDVGEGTLNLQFTDFDLQDGNGTHCIYDSLTIRRSVNGSVVNTYCGSNLPNNITSASGVLSLTLKTNENIVASGFRAIYWSSQESCFNVINGGGGVIETPNYPSSYLGTCVWYIDTLAGVARINFNRISSSGYYSSRYSPACSTSRLKVFDGRNEATLFSALGDYCGMNSRSNRTSGSRYLVVSMSVLSSSYRDLPARRLQAQFRSSTNCSETLQSGQGRVTSPDFPRYYDPYTNCSWLIDVLVGNASLQFKTFIFQGSTLGSAPCADDYLKVYDGNSTSASLIGTYCGRSMPSRMLASSRYLFLQMSSDESGSASGFSAEFWNSEKRCHVWGISDVDTRQINNTCYGFIRSLKSWSSARIYCESMNSSLVHFGSVAKFNAIKKWIYQDLGLSSNLPMWTAGYRRSSTNTRWFWSTLNGDIPFDDSTRQLWASRDRSSNSYIKMSDGGLYPSSSYPSANFLCEEHVERSTTAHVPENGCTPPPNIQYGYYFPPQQYYTNGTSVSFTCDPGFVMKGMGLSESTMTCVNRLWKGHFPICKELTVTETPFGECSVLPSIPNGEFTPQAEAFEHGSKVSVNCDSGYQLSKNESIICLRQQWHGELPHCVESEGKESSEASENKGKNKEQSRKSYSRLLGISIAVILILALIIIVGIVWQVIKQRKQRGRKKNTLLEMQE